MKIKDRYYIAFILILILLCEGICNVDTDTYSSFVSLKYQQQENSIEVISQIQDSSYETICTTGMIWGNRESLSYSNRSIGNSIFYRVRVLFFYTKILFNQFFYYIIIRGVLFKLFEGNLETLQYIHNQDGEK